MRSAKVPASGSGLLLAELPGWRALTDIDAAASGRAAAALRDPYPSRILPPLLRRHTPSAIRTHGRASALPCAGNLLDKFAAMLAGMSDPKPDDPAVHEETDSPTYADDRMFYKVEKWTRDRTRVDSLLYAGNSLVELVRCSRAQSSIGRGSD